MASLSLRHIYKIYDGTTKAVNDFNMEIRDKEFIVFVGPSGCGKSTTLRMIAGLEDISAGELRIDGVIVNDVEPGDRNIAMVFQNYALYPHMTVYENMAFSLRTARVPQDVIDQKVTEAARILGITEYLRRKPRALSGGQRQRVSLGRAIVRNPKVFLLDEPLSNLDAKLRAAMRAEITRLHERLGTTFIYVTHDQVEAMTMGSRIVVMRGGFVQQIDTPKNLYNHPSNLFVAGFIGTPRMNFWAATATLQRESATVRICLSGGGALTAAYADLNRVQTRYMDGAHPVVVGVRPDDVTPWRNDLDTRKWARLPITVTGVESLGGETLVYGCLGTAPADEPSAQDSAPPAQTTETPTREGTPDDRTVILKAPADFEVARGTVLEAAVNLQKLHLFDRETEASIKPRIPTENVCPCTVSENTLTLAGQHFALPPALRDRPQVTPTAYLTLPAEAILLGTGTVRALIEETETCDDGDAPRTLYRLTVGDSTLFALENAPPRFAAGDTVPFDLDFSRIAIEACGILPLPTDNRLNGRFTKEKTIDDRQNSPTRGRRVYRFYIDVEDHPVAASESLCETLFSCKGTAIFRTPLTYVIPARAVRVTRFTPGETADLPADDGSALFGRVTETLDYGRMVYACISIGSQTLIAPYDGCRGDRVRIIPDQTQISVIDRDADILIV